MMNVILGIMDQFDTKIAIIHCYGSVTYISWSSEFALFFENGLMDEHHSSDNGSI